VRKAAVENHAFQECSFTESVNPTGPPHVKIDYSSVLSTIVPANLMHGRGIQSPSVIINYELSFASSRCKHVLLCFSTKSFPDVWAGAAWISDSEADERRKGCSQWTATTGVFLHGARGALAGDDGAIVGHNYGIDDATVSSTSR
jgi:hypothetical protein